MNAFLSFSLVHRTVFRVGVTGLNPPLPENFAQKCLCLPFCCTVERVQLKNVTVDVMNIIVTITVGVKCDQESIKMHHCEGENTKIFWGGSTDPPQISPLRIRRERTFFIIRL